MQRSVGDSSHSNNYRSLRAFRRTFLISSSLILPFSNSLVPFGTKGTSKKKGGGAGVQVTEYLLGISEDPVRSSALKIEEGKKPSSLETSKKPEAVTTPNQNTEKN